MVSKVQKTLTHLLGAPSILFTRRLFSDSTLDLSPEEEQILGSIKLSTHSLYGDRFRELRRYWKRNVVSCMGFFVRNGFPFSKKLRDTLMRQFEGRTAPGELIGAYERTSFHYAAYLMLGMHRGQWLVPFLEDIRSTSSDELRGRRVLDYGCGVSDIGLILARHGAEVTLADLETPRLDFAQWRYDIREMRCERIGITDTEWIPDLPSAHFDLVVATEVLEHVRDPLALLRAFTEALKPGGLLFCSSGATLDREVGGDHLPEAIEIGKQAAYGRFFDQHYTLCSPPEKPQWLFTKREERNT